MELNHKDNTWKRMQWQQNLEGGKAERRVATCLAEQGKMNPTLAFEKPKCSVCTIKVPKASGNGGLSGLQTGGLVKTFV